MRLTETQREVLLAMAAGHKMVFSQDGDMAWLCPKHATGFLDDETVIGLRDAGYISSAPFDDDEHHRFGAPDVITPAGRAALEREGSSNE